VADDTALYRRLVSDALNGIPGIEVAGTSFDGDDCLAMMDKLKPDVITLDINMPKRDGLSTLREIRKRNPHTVVLMVSSANEGSEEQALEALRVGAVDMILKPSGHDFEQNRRSLENQLIAQMEVIQSLIGQPESRVYARESAEALQIEVKPKIARTPRSSHYNCLCIGVSTGGPAALATIVPHLPEDLAVPVFIVQHMPPLFTKSLADHLHQISKLPVAEASQGMKIAPGRVYIAPGGKQMKLHRSCGECEIVISDDPPVSGCKPSVDYLLDSVASVYGASALTLILTGMGDDGLRGCRKLFQLGATVLAQSAETCVVYGMPRHIVENKLADEVLPLDGIAARLNELLKAKPWRA
jgi:two-component system, chemotaxis family, protein-glutamate methylesterase/glutaminase